MRTLTRRLTDLEQRRRQLTAGTEVVRVLFSDELVPCQDHEGCHFEPSTGVHHAGVVHLRFVDQGSAR